MKTLPVLGTLFLSLLFYTQKAHADACTVAAPTVRVTSSTPVTGGCEIYLDLSFTFIPNNGNKYLNINLWRADAYPTVSYSSAPSSQQLYGTNNLPPLVSFALDNTPMTSNPPTFYTSYGNVITGYPLSNWQDATTGLAVVVEVIDAATKTYRYTIKNIKIFYANTTGCNGSMQLVGDSWSSQAANTNPTVHCASPTYDISVNDPFLSGTLNCGAYTTNSFTDNYTVNFSTTSTSNVTFKYDVYRDADGNGQLNTLVDVPIVTDQGFFTVTAGSPYSSGSQSYTVSTPQAAKQDIFIVAKNITIGGTVIDNSIAVKVVNGCLVALPIDFNQIKAVSKGGQLKVDWQALKEINCDKYVIEASKDGVAWKEITTIKSKATNGNSDAPVDYSFSTGLPLVLGGLSLAFLFMSIFKSRILRIGMFIVVLGVLGSCLKNGKDVDLTKEDALYVRIAQHDLDGSVHFSKIMKVVNE